jgi:hypothetical protein
MTSVVAAAAKLKRLERIVPRMMRRHEAVIYVNSPELFTQLEKAGWVKPSVQAHKMTLFDREMIDQALDRLLIEALPPFPAHKAAPAAAAGESSISGSVGAK